MKRSGQNGGSLSLLNDEAVSLTDAGTTTEERIAYLKLQGTFMLDTAHFSREFTDRLLASIDDLDAATDGLLVHGDNWQAPRPASKSISRRRAVRPHRSSIQYGHQRVPL